MPIDFNRLFAASQAGGASPQPSGSEADADGGAIPARAATRRDAPRAIANSALQALKALGPRLTPAQRTSIGILENYDAWRTQARTTGDMFDTQVLPEVDRETDYAFSRRPGFLLLKPVLDDFRAQIPLTQDDMGSPRTPAQRTTLTAQVAAAHEQAAAVQHQALAEARAGDRLCPLTLQPENFARFLEENRDCLERVIDHCGNLTRTHMLERDLEELALNYLVACDIEPSGIPEEDIHDPFGDFFDGSPVTVLIEQAHYLPDHAVLGNDESSACLIRLSRDGIRAMSEHPDNVFNLATGLSTDFARCTPQERAASMFLQDLFSQLAAIEQESVLNTATKNGTLFENVPAIRTGTENAYCGSATLGDECDDEHGPTQRDESLAGLYRLRHMAKVHEESTADPLLTSPELSRWIGGVEFSNDAMALATPRGRLERAQISAVSHALRATGVFRSLSTAR